MSNHETLIATEIGEVELCHNDRNMIIPSVRFIPKMNRNVFSYEQLIDQGLDVLIIDTLHLPDYAEQSKEYLREDFARFVKWFYEEHFNQKNKDYPPKLPNGSVIELLDLYMYIEEAGEYDKASKFSKWPEIAIKLGFDKSYATNLMIVYQGYLDLMSWRYKVEKEGEFNSGEPSCSLNPIIEDANKIEK
ncbi:hypothetical protein R6Q57_015239 [Mikania cordata]